MIPLIGLSGRFSYECFVKAPGDTEKVKKTFKCNYRPKINLLHTHTNRSKNVLFN